MPSRVWMSRLVPLSTFGASTRPKTPSLPPDFATQRGTDPRLHPFIIFLPSSVFPRSCFRTQKLDFRMSVAEAKSAITQGALEYDRPLPLRACSKLGADKPTTGPSSTTLATLISASQSPSCNVSRSSPWLLNPLVEPTSNVTELSLATYETTSSACLRRVRDINLPFPPGEFHLLITKQKQTTSYTRTNCSEVALCGSSLTRPIP